MIAHSQQTRKKAIDMNLAGKKKSLISRELGVDYDTLLGWLKRDKESPGTGLVTRYQNCGRKHSTGTSIKEAAIAFRKQHPEWGAGYIRLNLERGFPGEKVPGTRHIQRWLKAAGLQSMRTKLPPMPVEWAKKPLERVQVDAKECLVTQDGNPCCYLNYVDERTGAALDGFVFPLCPDQSSPPDSGTGHGQVFDVQMGLHR
jgi:hypothetical protein